MRNKATLLTHS